MGTMVPEGELTTRAGVLAGGDPFALVSAGAMSATVGTGRAVVQGTTAQGAYPVVNDAPVEVQFADGDAQFPRIDTVAVHVYDGLYDVDGQTIGRIEVVPGSPAAGPTAPDLPTAAIPLWDVRVAAGASAGVGGIDWATAVTDRRQYTTGHGGIVPAGLADVGAYVGQYRDRAGVLERWSGEAWETYRAPARAVETVTTGLTMGSGWTLVRFGARIAAGVVTFEVYATRTGGNISAGSNLPDAVVAILPAAIWPTLEFETIGSTGYSDGSVTVLTNGDLRLRTWGQGATLETGHNIRVSATYVL